MNDDERPTCIRCKEVCSDFRNLKLHASVVHKLKYFCVSCQQMFYNRSALYRHKMKSTSSNCNDYRLRLIKCGQCSKRFKRLVDLCEHVRGTHQIDIKIEYLDFPSRDLFDKWKVDVERDGNFAFVKKSNHKSSKFSSYTLLCHRSGYFVSKKKTKKAHKLLITNKLNFYCSAFASVKESLDNGQIKVQCCLNHYGHDNFLCEKKFSSATRRSIAKHLKDERYIKWILEILQSDVNDNENISKGEHLLTGVDIHKIKHDFFKRRDDEMESLDLNIRDTTEAVLCYSRGTENFFLGLQTIAQESLLRKFGSNVVCMYATHGTNQRKLLLITVLILDDVSRVLPVAWFLCHRDNEESLTILLTALKQRCGLIEAKAFMGSSQYFNVWSKVFPSDQTKRLLYPRNVLQNWRHNIKSKVTTVGARRLIWDILRRILKISTVEQFDRSKDMLLEIMGKFSVKFATYFDENYCTEERLSQWTAYSRKNVGIDTNLRIDYFHRTLKYDFLNKRETHRLDYLIHILLEISKFYIKTYTNQNNSNEAIEDVTEVQDVNAKNVQVVDNFWKVKSTRNNVVYTVKLAYDANKHIHRVHSLRMDFRSANFAPQSGTLATPLKELEGSARIAPTTIFDDIRKELAEITKMIEDKSIRDDLSRDPNALRRILSLLQEARKMMSSRGQNSTSQTPLSPINILEPPKRP